MTFTHRIFVAVMVLGSFASAQTKAVHPAKPAASTPAASPAKSGLPTEDTVNSFLFQMLGYEPTLTWKVVEIRPSEAEGLAEVTFVLTTPQGSGQNKIYVSTDGHHAVLGKIIPFGAKPFDADKAKLEKGVNGPAKGPEHAPVTIVEFSDMQCPHCKEAAPMVESLVAQEPDVRFVFQNFPLPLHNWAEKAAEYVDCVGRSSNEAVWKFIDKTFEQQATITEANVEEKLKSIATDSGVNADEIAACAAKPEAMSRVEASVALGKSAGVSGTPAIFINGQLVDNGTPVEQMKKIVEFKASQVAEKH
jgi:protein-disulfide isomerase